MSRRIAVVLMSIVIPVWAAARETRDVVGATHASGTYSLNSTDYLNQGAARLQTLGTRVIKVWLTHAPRQQYPYNSPAWPTSGSNLTTVVQTSYFRNLFNRPFTTYVMVVSSRCNINIRDGMSTQEQNCEYAQFLELSRHLLQTYRNTGKTFVLQNWEIDNMMGAFTETGAEGARVYLTTRQRAVNTARAELGQIGMTLLHAAEVNHIMGPRVSGESKAVNRVLPTLRQAPYLEPDLYSYSAWDYDPTNPNSIPGDIVLALDYLQAQTGASRDRIYLGEYGAGEPPIPIPEDVQRDRVAMITQAALSWGARYVLYWQTFSNDSTPMPNKRAWWLVKPDGSLPLVWHYFQDLLRTSFYRVTLRNNAYSRYMSANPASGAVTTTFSAGDNETLVLFDLDGGQFVWGNRVALLDHLGHYLTAENGGGIQVVANRWLRGAWEEFTIDDPFDGVIDNQSNILFTALSGHNVRALSTGVVRADGPPGQLFNSDILWRVTMLP